MLVSVSNLDNSRSMHPFDIFKWMAIRFSVDSVEYDEQKNGTKVWSFVYGSESVPDDFIKAFFTIRKYSHKNDITYNGTYTAVKYVQTDTNETLILEQHNIKYRVLYRDGKLRFVRVSDDKNVVFHVYDNGVVWNYTQRKYSYSSATGFPCSMKDFFYYQDKQNSIAEVIYQLFLYWGRFYPLWNDLAFDFYEGSAYASIPLDLIFQCNTKKQLLGVYYGDRIRRADMESIGKGIFLVRARKYVAIDDYPMLFDCDVSPCHISRDKETLVQPFYNIMSSLLEKQFGDDGCQIMRSYDVMEMIRIALKNKTPLRFDFESTSDFIKYFDEVNSADAYKECMRSIPVVRIPKNSRFKNLKLPAGYVHITSRKQIAKLYSADDFDITEFVPDINADKASVWFCRTDSGAIFVFDIRIRKSKNNPNGYFYINNKSFLDFMEFSDDDYNVLKDCIDRCCV